MTGEVLVADASVLDFERREGPYELTIAVTDEDGLQTQRTLVVVLADVNEPPVALVSAPSWSVEEGVPVTVGTASATDLDDGDQITWSIVEDLSGIFDIDPVTGDVVLRAGDVLDFEAATSHALLVRATDLAGLSVDIPIDITVLDADVIEQQVRLNFRMRGRSLYEDAPTDQVASVFVDVIQSEFLPAVCFEPGDQEGFWIDEWNQTLGEYVELPFQLQAESQGRICVNLDIAYDPGAWNADVPIDISLAVPDEVPPDSQFELTSSWAVDWSQAALWGSTPGLDIRGEIVAEQFGMVIFGCESIWNRFCGTQALPPQSDVIADEFRQPVVPFVAAYDPVDDRLETPTLVQATNGFEWDASHSFATMLALAGQPAHIGRIEVPMENLGPMNEDATAYLDYVMWQALIVIDILNQYDVRLEVDGVDALLLFEDGTTTPFVVGQPLTVDVPASADVDGDGSVAVDVEFDVRLGFRNVQDTWFEAGTQVWAGQFEFLLENQDNEIVGRRIVGPAVEKSCGLFSNVVSGPVAGRFSVPCVDGSFIRRYDQNPGAPADQVVRGAIQLQ